MLNPGRMDTDRIRGKYTTKMVSQKDFGPSGIKMDRRQRKEASGMVNEMGSRLSSMKRDGRKKKTTRKVNQTGFVG